MQTFSCLGCLVLFHLHNLKLRPVFKCLSILRLSLCIKLLVVSCYHRLFHCQLSTVSSWFEGWNPSSIQTKRGTTLFTEAEEFVTEHCVAKSLRGFEGGWAKSFKAYARKGHIWLNKCLYQRWLEAREGVVRNVILCCYSLWFPSHCWLSEEQCWADGPPV